ncbi:MAG TPA: hypothetical protein VLX68_17380 [Chitinivibrionales bacterium]|nr:hypothetical protein [Chitinivibrionales bacterium]
MKKLTRKKKYRSQGKDLQMINSTACLPFRALVRIILVAAVALALGCSGQKSGAAITGPTATGSTQNLIVNGNAEAAAGSIDGTPVTTPGWVSQGEATAAQYGINLWPALTDTGPADRGLNLFSGGQDDSASSLTQAIDVSRYASSIDKGHVTYTLSGWLGGYDGQDDNSTVSVTFKDGQGHELGTGSIGPVLASDRSNQTGLLPQSSEGPVPAKTRTATVEILMIRTDGTNNDGYADNLSIVFNGIDSTLLGSGALLKTGAAQLPIQAPTAP